VTTGWPGTTSAYSNLLKSVKEEAYRGTRKAFQGEGETTEDIGRGRTKSTKTKGGPVSEGAKKAA